MSKAISAVERVLLVLAGWTQQFENPPQWLPEVKEENGILIVDEYPVCPSADVIAVSAELTALFIDTDDARFTLQIDWPFEGSPTIAGLDSRTF